MIFQKRIGNCSGAKLPTGKRLNVCNYRAMQVRQ